MRSQVRQTLGGRAVGASIEAFKGIGALRTGHSGGKDVVGVVEEDVSEDEEEEEEEDSAVSGREIEDLQA